MILHIVILLILLVCSAFFSGAETALFSLSRYELARLQRAHSRTGRLVAELLQHPRRLLLTLMIGNVTMNLFIFALSMSLFRRLGGRSPLMGVVLGMVTPVVVTLAADILPKSLAILLRRRLALAAAPIVRLIQVALGPVNYILLTFFVTPLTRLLSGNHRPDEYVTTEELEELIELSGQHRIIDADENAMLGEVIQLGELHVYHIMVPRVDMVAFDIHDEPARLRELIREHKFTKLPVYDASIDNILGIVRAKDVYLNPAREPGTLVRPVSFVPEIITLTQLLDHFRRTKTQLAIAVNEYGEVAGLVTVQDVATQIVGDLTTGRTTEDEPKWIKLTDRRYRVSGSVSIRDWSEQFSFYGVEDSVTTLAGLIQVRLGRLPTPGDHVHLGNIILTVETVTHRRVEWVQLELTDRQDDPREAAQAKEARP